jgi:predicted PurR-regulated permease PerM
MPHSGPVCGHSGCGTGCNVRYSGPTSHPRDHLIHQAAHGARHIWAAAIVAGLAVVLTGAIAVTAVQAETELRNWNSDREVLTTLSHRIDRLEQSLQAVNERLAGLSEQLQDQSGE